PGQAVEGEAVVEFGHIDVARSQSGPRPQMRGLAQYLWFVGRRALIPFEPFDELCAHRLDEHRWAREVARRLPGRDDHRDRAVARYIAVVQPEWCGDRPRAEVVVHGERVAVDRRRIQRGIGALVERDPAQGFPIGAVTVEMPLRGL